MRLVIAGLAAAALGVAPASAAQTTRIGFVSEPGAQAPRPVAAASLATGEILFELEVTGKALSPPDQTLLMVNFSTSGETAASARTAGQATRQRLVEIARGFDAQSISGSNPSGMPFGAFGFSSDELMVMPIGSGEDDNRLARGYSAMGGTRFRLGNARRIGELRDALQQAGALTITGPIFILDDDTEARRRARDDALARAREEADRFASSQHMRVARLVSFSESSADATSFQNLLSQWTGQSPASSPQVETRLTARVAFALVPE